MHMKRLSEKQIVSILKESAAGMKTEEVCRRHGICTNTFYRWKAKYVDMEISDIRKLEALEDENNRLKWIVAEQALYIQARKGVPQNRSDAPPAPRGCGCDGPGNGEQRASGLPLGRDAPLDLPVPGHTAG